MRAISGFGERMHAPETVRQARRQQLKHPYKMLLLVREMQFSGNQRPPFSDTLDIGLPVGNFLQPRIRDSERP
jgi:hypothetical protein